MLLPLLAPAPKARRLSPRRRSVGCQGLAESRDGREGFVDAPLLFRGDPADQISKPSGVDGADLLNQDVDGLARATRSQGEAMRPWRCETSARPVPPNVAVARLAWTITPYRRPRCSWPGLTRGCLGTEEDALDATGAGRVAVARGRRQGRTVPGHRRAGSATAWRRGCCLGPPRADQQPRRRTLPMAGHHVADRGRAIEDHPPTRLAGTDVVQAPRGPAVTGVGVEWVW